MVTVFIGIVPKPNWTLRRLSNEFTYDLKEGDLFTLRGREGEVIDLSEYFPRVRYKTKKGEWSKKIVSLYSSELKEVSRAIK